MAESIRGLAQEYGWLPVIRVIVRGVFWDGEMKFVTGGWVALLAGMALLWHFVSVGLAVGFFLVGAFAIYYFTHSYWTYERMRDDEDFDYNPVAGALVGTALMYVVCFVAVIVVFAFWIAVAHVTGLPVVLPGVIASWLLYTAYTFWWKRR